MKRKTRLQVIVGDEVEQMGVSIHNLRNEKPHKITDVKCDRSSPLGNPVGLQGDESKRDWACNHYADWFKKEVLSFNNWPAYEELMRIRHLYRTHGELRIFCWCAPLRCHTQTIATWLESNS